MAAPPRRRCPLPDRDRRARAEDPARRRGAGRQPAGVGGHHERPVPRRLGRPRHQLRRLHPDHRGPPPDLGAGLPPAGLRQRLHRARDLRGPLLRGLRGLLHRGRPPRGAVPRARAPGGDGHRGELLLPALEVRAAAARPLRGPSRGRPPRRQAQRGPRLHPPGAAGLLDEPHLDPLGDPPSRGTPPTSPMSGTTRSSTTRPRRGSAPIPSGSPTAGPSSTTSSPRTSCASTPSTGPRC